MISALDFALGATDRVVDEVCFISYFIKEVSNLNDTLLRK